MTLLNDTYQWQLVTDDITLTDEVGEPVSAVPDHKRATIAYAGSGEKAPLLTRGQIVYIDHLEHDILIGDKNIYVRLRPENFYNF